ncbi:MAG: SRPBCC family protein [Pseudomonadota bacterium]
MRPLQLSAPTDTTIVIKRSFDAPKSLVWRAHTEPDLVKRWLTGPTGHRMPVCEIDLRVGGTYRYVWEWDDGMMTASGQFQVVAADKRLQFTEVFDIFPDNETQVEQLFAETDGKTLVTMRLQYDSRETRDGVLQSPMEQGLEASYCQLDALISETV